MRTKRSDPPVQAPPISAGIASRARRSASSDDRDGDGRAQLLRVVALLGIGLVAAAILLPSSDPGVVVPGDALQPAASAATPGPAADGNEQAPTKAPGQAPRSTFAAGSSAASVAGDDLPAPSTPPSDPAQAKRARGETSTPRPGPKAKAKRRAKPRPQRARRAPAAAPVQPSPAPVPAPAAANPAPASASPPAQRPAPAPKRARGGPKAEFGGL